MTNFIQLLVEKDKSEALEFCTSKYRRSQHDARIFDVDTEVLKGIPGAPFAYWVGAGVRDTFRRLPSLRDSRGTACVGLQTSDDFRFIRLWWETPDEDNRWVDHAKGGEYSPYYSDVYLKVNWKNDGYELKAWADPLYGNSGWSRIIKSTDYYFRPGVTWTKSTTLNVSFRCMPSSTIFGVSGLGFFVEGDTHESILAYLAVMNSISFRYLISMSLGLAAEGRKHYEAGIINKNPFPVLSRGLTSILANHAARLWMLKYRLNSVDETSHAFLLPEAIRLLGGEYDQSELDVEVQNIEREIDQICYTAYGFSELDSKEAQIALGEKDGKLADENISGGKIVTPSLDTLLTWAAGVAMGRFDWRLATGEREIPAVPKPFDPLPSKSPGMLSDNLERFHRHQGVLVDDPDHEHDLYQLIDSVLGKIDIQPPDNLRHWLQKEFFKKHLRQYSKSRRKGPIYWPITTASGSYTLWLYYPELDDQTLYTVVNDFVEPKINMVVDVLITLRAKTSRTAAEEREFERLLDLERELIELRDNILVIAPSYKPNRDDGVQITAAPLWPLFAHKAWQKILSDTWAKMEGGQYDWAHLAYSYWPDRVREKCISDRSLAIAHGLEELYEEPTG